MVADCQRSHYPIDNVIQCRLSVLEEGKSRRKRAAVAVEAREFDMWTLAPGEGNIAGSRAVTRFSPEGPVVSFRGGWSL